MSLTAEETSRFVRADDVRIHYHEAGEGPVLLCIHGGAPGAYGWGNFGQNLDALSRQFRTLIVDLPGYGRSDKPAITGGRFSFYARTFRAMLEALDVERAHVLGMATGGGAAMMMAINHPEVVDRLVLVSSFGGVPMFQPSPSEGQKMIRGYYGGDGPSMDKMRRYLEMMLFDRSRITDDLVRERYEASIDPDFMAHAPEGRGARDEATNEPIWKDMDRIAAPTLVIWGRDNRVQGYDNALFMLNRIPDVQLHVYGRTGLWVPWERAREFEDEVTGFLLRD